METKKNNIWRLFGRESMGKSQKNKKPLRQPTKNNIWRLFGKAPLTKSKNLEKTKKTKNQNVSENVWSEAHVCFFLVLPSFFCFFLVLTWKKLKKLNVFLVFWIKWWLKNCEKPKKLEGFFGFSLRSQKETKATNTQKPKNPWVFFVFHNYLTIILSKKPKTLEFF